MWVRADDAIQQAVDAVWMHTGLCHVSYEHGRSREPPKASTNIVRVWLVVIVPDVGLVLVGAPEWKVASDKEDPGCSVSSQVFEGPGGLHDHVIGTRTGGDQHDVMAADMALAKPDVRLAVAEASELGSNDIH